MQHQLDPSTIQRLVQDDELSLILEDMISNTSISTQAGYKCVLNQFLCSEVVKAKAEEWANEKEDKAKEKAVAKPLRRISVTEGLQRFARSSSLALELDSSDGVKTNNTDSTGYISSVPTKHGSISSFIRSNSTGTTSSVPSGRGSIPSFIGAVHSTGISPVPTKRGSISSFIGSFKINLNLDEEAEPRYQEEFFLGSSNLSARPRRRTSYCPTTSSKNHVGIANRRHSNNMIDDWDPDVDLL